MYLNVNTKKLLQAYIYTAFLHKCIRAHKINNVCDAVSVHENF